MLLYLHFFNIANKQKQTIMVALSVCPLGIDAPLPGKMFFIELSTIYGLGRLIIYFKMKLAKIERP